MISGKALRPLAPAHLLILAVFLHFLHFKIHVGNLNNQKAGILREAATFETIKKFLVKYIICNISIHIIRNILIYILYPKYKYNVLIFKYSLKNPKYTNINIVLILIILFSIVGTIFRME